MQTATSSSCWWATRVICATFGLCLLTRLVPLQVSLWWTCQSVGLCSENQMDSENCLEVGYPPPPVFRFVVIVPLFNLCPLSLSR